MPPISIISKSRMINIEVSISVPIYALNIELFANFLFVLSILILAYHKIEHRNSLSTLLLNLFLSIKLFQIEDDVDILLKKFK